MAFTPKDWKDDPDHTTPISAAALEDLETRVADYADDVGTATLAAAVAADNSPLTISTQTGDYTLALGDAQTKVEINAATAKTVTVPANATVAFPTGTTIEVGQVGAGAVTAAAAGGVSFTAPYGLTTGYQGSSLYLTKEATNSWTVLNGGQLTVQYSRVSGSDYTNATNSFTNVTGLTATVGASEVWGFDAFLVGNCATANGSQFSVNGPSGATVECGVMACNTSSSTFRYERITGLDGAVPAFWKSAAAECMARLTGVMVVSSTAGTLAMRARSNTNTETTTVRISSSLRAWRIA